jgi:hypothetical protein
MGRVALGMVYKPVESNGRGERISLTLEVSKSETNQRPKIRAKRAGHEPRKKQLG